MGSPFGKDSRLQNFSNVTDDLALKLMEVLSQCYLNGDLTVGSIGEYSKDSREAYFTITDSEFENVILHFKYVSTKDKSSYQIELISRSSDSPSEFKIYLDDVLLNNLPKAMLEELDEEFYSFMETEE
jgi:hypothetical protein